MIHDMIQWTIQRNRKRIHDTFYELTTLDVPFWHPLYYPYVLWCIVLLAFIYEILLFAYQFFFVG